MPRSKIPTMTALPYSIRQYYVREAKKRGERLSPYLRRLLISLYESREAWRKMEKTERERTEEERNEH